jgi:hypothetical protein
MRVYTGEDGGEVVVVVMDAVMDSQRSIIVVRR